MIKQPGTAGHDLELRLHLPAGLAAAPSLPMTTDGDALVYRGRLTETLDLRLRFDPDGR